MTSDLKANSLLVKLNQETAKGHISWSITDPPSAMVRATDLYVPLFLSANYKSQSLGIYQVRSRAYDGERDDFYWSEAVGFAIFDASGRVIWEAPARLPALFDLFEAARQKAANVDGLLETLLEDNPE